MLNTAFLVGYPRRIHPLRLSDHWDDAFFRFNPNVGNSAAFNIQINLPVPHGARYASYLGLGGGGGAGQNTIAGNAAGGGGSGALVLITFKAPFLFDRVEAQIGYGGQVAANADGSAGGDTILKFYYRGNFIYRLTAGKGGGSLKATQSVGGTGGSVNFNRMGRNRAPQIGREHPVNVIAGMFYLSGLDGEAGEARGNDVGGDGADSGLSLITRRFGDCKGALGGLSNNASATLPSGGQGWGTGGGAGVGAGLSQPGKGGGAALLVTDEQPVPANINSVGSVAAGTWQA